MLRYFLVFIYLVCFFTYFSKAQGIKDTIYREADIYPLLDQIATDSLLQLEWLTSIHFHKMMNDYRNSKNYKSIHWDHKLWMAARNHNVYLLRNDGFLSHSQSKGNTFYTGQRPQDRVDFVIYHSKEFKLAGFENCNFSGFELSKDRIDKGIVRNISSGSSEKIDKIAKEAAAKGLEIWKKSDGHNKNMLNPDHIAHGTSFVFGEEGTYGTTVFANNQKFYSPDNIFLPYITEIISKEAFKVKSNYPIISLPKHELGRINYKHWYLIKEFFAEKGIQANKSLFELARLKSDVDDHVSFP